MLSDSRTRRRSGTTIAEADPLQRTATVDVHGTARNQRLAQSIQRDASGLRMPAIQRADAQGERQIIRPLLVNQDEERSMTSTCPVPMRRSTARAATPGPHPGCACRAEAGVRRRWRQTSATAPLP